MRGTLGLLLLAGYAACAKPDPTPELNMWIAELPRCADKEEVLIVMAMMGQTPKIHEVNKALFVFVSSESFEPSDFMDNWGADHSDCHIQFEHNQPLEGNTIECPDIQAEPLGWGQKYLNLESLTDPLGLGGFKHNTTWGSGVDIFIIDSGVNCDHEELVGRCTKGNNYISNEEHVDHTGHGTHIAGTAAGKTYGVAKKAEIISVKVLDRHNSGLVSGFIQALEWATTAAVNAVPRRATVINLSLSTHSVSQAMNAAVAAASADNVLVVAAAGNDGGDACVLSPASAPSALTVGVLSTDDTGAHMVHQLSNTGTCVDVFAPGLNIKAADARCTTCYRLMSGTSMAAPHVAGAAAAYWSTKPNALMSEVTTFIISNTLPGILPQTLKGSPDRSLHLPCSDTTTYSVQSPGYFPVQSNCHGHYFAVGAGKGTMSYPPSTPPNTKPYENYEFTCFNIECPNNKLLTIRFTFMDIELDYDFLHIGKLGNMTAYTGTQLKTHTQNGTALLVLMSDISVNGNGFALEYECAADATPPPTPVPTTPVPETPIPTTPVPETPVPAPVAEGTTKIRITTKNGLYAGSVGTFDVTLAWKTGDTATKTIAQPTDGSEFILEHVGGAGFPSAGFLATITVAGRDDVTSNDDWHIASVEVWRTGVWWERWADAAGNKEATIDRDSADFPSSVVFINPGYGRYTSSVEISTGSRNGETSTKPVQVRFIYRNGEEDDVGTFVPDTRGHKAIMFQSRLPVEEVMSVRFTGTDDHWVTRRVAVGDVRWSRATLAIGGTGPLQRTINRPVRSTVRFIFSTTGESTGHFPVSLTFGSITEVVGYVLSPRQGIMTFTTEQAAAGPAELVAVTIGNSTISNAGAWTIAYIKMQKADGSWENLILPAHSNNIGGVPVGGDGQPLLVFRPQTPVQLYDIAVEVATAARRWSEIGEHLIISVRSASGKQQQLVPKTGFELGSVVELLGRATFPPEDVRELIVEHVGAHDKWYYVYTALHLAGTKVPFIRSGKYNGWSAWNTVRTFTLEMAPPVTVDVQYTVKITTHDHIHSASAHTYPIKLVFAGGVESLGDVVSPARDSVVTLTKAFKYDYSRLLAVRIQENGIDGWRIEKVEVLDPTTGTSKIWKSEGRQSQWVKDEAHSRLRDFDRP